MKHITLSLAVLAGLLFLSIGAAADALFEETTLIEQCSGACAIAAADFNEDGHMDLVYTCYQLHHIKWLENDGAQQFTPHTVIEGFTKAKAIDVGDINRDGHMDFVATSDTGNRISWFLNDGAGNFTERVLTTAWVRPNYVLATEHFQDAPIDINSDGHTDILATACQSGRLGWFENDGDANFEEHIIKDDWTVVSGATAADVDGDNDVDILAAGQAGGIVLFENIGDDEVFTEHLIFDGWDKPNWIQAGDIDGDGDIDFAATSCGVSDAVGWFEQTSPLHWDLHLLRDGYGGARSPVLADIEGDGDVDIFSMAWQGQIATFWDNDGAQNFTERTLSTNAYDMLKFFVVNLDGDDDLDLVASSGAVASVHIRWFDQVDHFLQVGALADPCTGHAPLSVAFQEDCYARPAADAWSWDLDGDRVVDSHDPDPSFHYTVPGDYDVTLLASNGPDSEGRTFERFIRVFDGESCQEFDGETHRCEADAASALDFTTAFTLEAWINPLNWGEGPLQGGRIFDKGYIALYLCESYPYFNERCLAVKIVNEGAVSAMACSASDPIPLDDWSHVAVTYDADGSDLRLYVNGAPCPLAFHTHPDGELAAHSQFRLNVGGGNNGANAFAGRIDEVRVWSLARGEAEIAAAWNGYLAGDEPGLEAYWQMNEGAGATVGDATANGIALTPLGSRWAQGTDFGVVTDVDDAPPACAGRLRAWPNPFNPSTTFSFTLAEAARVDLTVYDAGGRRLRRLTRGPLGAGDHSFNWDGLDANGRPVGSGVYLCALRLNGEVSACERCVLLK